MISKLLGVASVLFKSRKYALLLAGAQFAYLGYKYLKKGKKLKQKLIK